MLKTLSKVTPFNMFLEFVNIEDHRVIFNSKVPHPRNCVNFSLANFAERQKYIVPEIYKLNSHTESTVINYA